MLLPVTLDSVRTEGTTAPDYNKISSQYSNVSTMSWGSYNNPRGAAGGGGGTSYGAAPLSVAADQGEEATEDFFSGMAPRIKKQKKVLLGGNKNESANFSDKFSVETFGLSTSPLNELGTIEESSFHHQQASHGDSWEEETAATDLDESLREAREAERQRRLLEHKRIKEQKEKDKKSGRSKANLAATKLS
jgi:hypothetical protein